MPIERKSAGFKTYYYQFKGKGITEGDSVSSKYYFCENDEKSRLRMLARARDYRKFIRNDIQVAKKSEQKAAQFLKKEMKQYHRFKGLMPHGPGMGTEKELSTELDFEEYELAEVLAKKERNKKLVDKDGLVAYDKK